MRAANSSGRRGGRALLFEKGCYYYNRFQLIPSPVIEKESIDRAVDILDRAMTMAETRSGIGG